MSRLAPPAHGVGIVFEVGTDHNLYIKDLVPNQPAQATGQLKPSDVLVGIDDLNVSGCSIEQVISLISGRRQNEAVKLVLQRKVDFGTCVCNVRYEIMLRRGVIDHSAPMHVRGLEVVSVSPDGQPALPTVLLQPPSGVALNEEQTGQED